MKPMETPTEKTSEDQALVAKLAIQEADNLSKAEVEVLAGQIQLHKAIDPKWFEEFRKRARQGVEVLATAANVAVLKRVRDSAPKIPVDTAGEVSDLANTYRAIEQAQTWAHGGPAGASVVPIQFNVSLGDVV